MVRPSLLNGWIFGVIAVLTACTDGGGPEISGPLDNKLLFTSVTSPDTAQIVVMNPDGSGQVRLTNGPGFRYGPVASPDGSKIVFARIVSDPSDSDIYLVDFDGSHLTPLVVGATYDQEPDWSPDGGSIVFQRGSDLYTISIDGSSLHQLTSTPQLSEESPVWSPDGTRIAFVGLEGLERDIYVMNADGSNAMRLAAMPGEDQSPAWSPDGTRLAFSHEEPAGVRHLYVMNADGSDLHAVTSGDLRDYASAWSPDGSQLVFGRLLLDPGELYQDLWVLNLADGSVVRLTRTTGSAMSPSWAFIR